MKNTLCFVILASLLIGGCGTTKLVTGAEREIGTVRIAPLLENPTLTENLTPGMAPSMTPATDDVCVGVMSHLYF